MQQKNRQPGGDSKPGSPWTLVVLLYLRAVMRICQVLINIVGLAVALRYQHLPLVIHYFT